MFLAHKNSIDLNEYHVLEQYNKEKVLIYNNGYHLVSNICTHQNSIISQSDGIGIRMCPYHSWTFNIDGEPIGSGRTKHYCENKNKLQRETVYEWNNLLFDKLVDFKVDQNFNDLILMEKRIDYVNADYKIIMDLFLDVDHIQCVHKGVYDRVGITNTEVTWDYYSNGNIQTVDQGALWISVYPSTMIEWQKGSLFVTVALPDSINKSKVLVYKYLDKNYVNDWKLNEEVWEEAWLQDRSQAERIRGFPKNNLEEQKLHFRNYLQHNGIN